MKTIAAEEGPLALWNGLTPGLQRQFIFAGLRIGLYVPVRDLICGPLQPGQNPTLLQKVEAGLATGAIGISVANPTDLVKIRMQAQGRLPPDQRPYKGSLDCYSKVYAAGGIKGFWVGWGPNVMRNSIINAVELASYDQYKQFFTQQFGLRDGLHTHTLCAFGAGLNAVIFGSPVDVLKTRIMNRNAAEAQSVAALIASMIRKEGFGAFYKGVTQNFFRLSLYNVVLFVSLEQIKKAFA
jgi:solute carrier family 25 (mitochondrial uncoupling protein), member 8/9